MPCGTLAGVAATTNCQSNILFRILNEGSGVSGLELENWTINPFVVAVAPGQALLRVAINIEDPRGTANRRVRRHADVGERLLELNDFEVGFELAPPQSREISLIVRKHGLAAAIAIVCE